GTGSGRGGTRCAPGLARPPPPPRRYLFPDAVVGGFCLWVGVLSLVYLLCHPALLVCFPSGEYFRRPAGGAARRSAPPRAGRAAGAATAAAAVGAADVAGPLVALSPAHAASIVSRLTTHTAERVLRPTAYAPAASPEAVMRPPRLLRHRMGTGAAWIRAPCA